jgi:hypothetical protein
MAQLALRRFGPPLGAPGVEVIERSGNNAMSDPRYGSTALFGVLKRGPMGIPIPIASRRDYEEIFGDPRDPRWHLYPSGSHLLPDAIDGFFSNGGGAGMLWLTRLDLDGKARKASIVLKNRLGSDALRILAANEGQWGGAKNSVASTPIVVATSRTFTLVAPSVRSNEFVGAEAEFTGVAGKRYKIVANTEAHPASGEVIFTVAAQYDLVADAVSGPVALAGTATYTRYRNLAGSVAFPLYKAVTGTVTVNNTVITGNGTDFSGELRVGGNLYLAGEARVIQSITSDTTATIDSAFSTVTGTGLTVQVDNLEIAGTTSTFTTDIEVGDTVYITIGSELQGRTVAAIDSDTSLTLSSGFTQAVSAGTILQADNLTLTGTTTQFTTELAIGQYLIDPNRQGDTVKIVAIDSATSLTLEKPFSSNFAAAQLTKQNQKGAVYLDPVAGKGLAVQIGQGVRYPDTHFSIEVFFNGSSVLSIADASLDPDDEYFVEPLVNDGNVAYRTGSSNYQKWITVEVLWNSAYTTASGSDVRPCNGTGKILALTPTLLYTVGDLDYAAVVGNLVYPNPYSQPRNYLRVKAAQAAVALQGTISSTGVAVTGTSTNFLSVLKPGDYLYDPNTDSARKIRSVTSNTALTLETAFSSNVPALTKAKKAGYLQVDQGYDLTQISTVNTRFLTVYQQFLEKGFDGDTAHLIPYYFTKFADVDRNVLESAVWGKQMGLIKMACPGISDVAIQKAFAFYASQKAYEFRCEVPSQYTNAATAESWVTQTLGRDDFISVCFPSYGFISNPLGAGDRFVPLTGEILGGEARLATAVEGYHVPFAGMNSILARVIKLPFEPLPTDESILNVAGIQPVKTLDGKVIVWGARVPSRSPTYDFLHVRRIQSNYVRLFLEARVLLEAMFQPNQPALIEQVVMTLNNFARREYKKGVFTKYLSFSQAVSIGTGVNSQGVVTDEDSQDAIVAIINGRLEVSFRYVPTGIVERLSIFAGPDVVVAQYGGSLTTSGSV